MTYDQKIAQYKKDLESERKSWERAVTGGLIAGAALIILAAHLLGRF